VLPDNAIVAAFDGDGITPVYIAKGFLVYELGPFSYTLRRAGRAVEINKKLKACLPFFGYNETDDLEILCLQK